MTSPAHSRPSTVVSAGGLGRGLRDAGTTVLHVTHQLDGAEALCDRVVAVRNGRVLDAGAPADLVTRREGWAEVRFGRHDPSGDGRDDLVGTLRDIPGVQLAETHRDQVRVRGERQGHRARRRRAGVA